MTWIRRAAAVTALGTGVGAAAAVGVLALGSWVAGEVAPMATQPCEPSFAASLAEDPLITEAVPGDVGPGEFGATGCQDADDGGVSYAEQSRATTASAEDVTAQVAVRAQRRGWDHVRVVRTRDRQASERPTGVCAVRVRDGHTLQFALQFEEPVRPDSGTRTYLLSITGDAGDYPTCSAD